MISTLLAFATAAYAQQAVVPTALEPAPTEKMAFVVAAKGVQIYECRARKEGGGTEWVFVAPEADLVDARGQAFGTHGAGPFWQAADGSRIEGTVKQRADAPNAGAIPWLLLAARSTALDGTLRDVTSVQRINTVGGVAPAGECTAGAVARVPYTADYRFFKAK
jgi:hypothetical protein